MDKGIIAIQGDELNNLDLTKDSSLYIASVMQDRGYRIFWYNPYCITYIDDEFIANGKYISIVVDDDILSIKIICEDTLILNYVKCIMIRQNPPITMEYIFTTHILSLLHIKCPNIYFFNHPTVLRNYVEKFLPLICDSSNQYIPPTLISNDINEITHFLKKHQRIVVKPIYGYGGNDVILVDSIQNIQSLMLNTRQIPFIVQKFLVEVYNGDKRVIVCNGIILGVIGRKPMKGSILTNTSMGGHLEVDKLTITQQEICIKIATTLQELQIFFAGIDLIGDYVIEVNITSPGLLFHLQKMYGFETVKYFFDNLERNIIVQNNN